MSNKVKLTYGQTPIFELEGYQIGTTVGHVLEFKPEAGEVLELDSDYSFVIGSTTYTTANEELSVEFIDGFIRVTFILQAGIITEAKTYSGIFRSLSNSAPKYLKAILKITGVDC